MRKLLLILLFPCVLLCSDIQKTPLSLYSYVVSMGEENLFDANLYTCGSISRNDIGIGFMHGLFVSYDDCLAHAEKLSSLAGGSEVQFVHQLSEGYLVDLVKYRLASAYSFREPCSSLWKMWDSFFLKSPSDAVFLMFCHSAGALHVRNALLNYPESLRKRIIVIAIAPAAYIDDGLCGLVEHYRVEYERDYVPYLDKEGYLRCEETIMTLECHPTASDFDHWFDSPTYLHVIESKITDYIFQKVQCASY